jgi:hypothetical protein
MPSGATDTHNEEEPLMIGNYWRTRCLSLRSRLVRVLICAGLAACSALAGCSVKVGGPGSALPLSVFDQPGIGIVFNYPVWLAGPTAVHDPPPAVGRPSTAGFALSMADYDGIGITRYDQALNRPIDESGLDAIHPQLDALVARSSGIPVTGTKVYPGGLFGLSYELPMPGVADGHISKTMLFDGTTEYVLDCLSTQAHRTEMTQACQIALTTLHRRYPGPTSRFNQADYGISSDYPSQLKLISNVTEHDPSPAPDCVAKSPPTMLLLDGYDTLVIFWCDMNENAPDSNLDVLKKRLDDASGKAFPGASGTTGAKIEAGGLPGLEYNLPLLQAPGGAMRYVALLGKNGEHVREYIIECQSTPNHRPEIDQACQLVLNTIHHR